MIKFSIKNSRNGFSLTEMLIYVSILGIVAVLTIDFLIQIVNVYHRAQAEREVISNARLILETIEKNTFEANGIYGPTSVFNEDAGQLSLTTPVGPTAGHDNAYIDFWLDNGRFWMRKEGESATPLSAASVVITKFYLERIIQGLESEAVKITLEVEYVNPKYSTSITLNSTAATRGSY